ncbi:MAG: class I SAM-dependent methyltransferase [Thermoanaerobaculia bacterium]
MKPFELTYLCLEPFLLPLHRKVRKRLLSLTASDGERPRVLDIGGRKSHYTIGVPADVTITDLLRQSETQRRLNLGLNEGLIRRTYSRRSNVCDILLDDMTRSRLPSGAFTFAVAVEVLEHVEEDNPFVEHVARVLKPGGVFLMTTPNGDYVRNTNPDHKRHYTRQALQSLLSEHFDSVVVEYAIPGGFFRKLGLRAWSVRHPLRTVAAMVGNLINSVQAAQAGVKERRQGTHHLIAVARKRG